MIRNVLLCSLDSFVFFASCNVFFALIGKNHHSVERPAFKCIEIERSQRAKTATERWTMMGMVMDDFSLFSVDIG